MSAPPVDWKARAEREAAALLDGLYKRPGATLSHAELVSVVAASWLQGFNLGAHATLAQAEDAFDRLRALL